MSGAPVIEARDVWMEYVDGGRIVPVLRGVDLVVHPAEFVGLMGPSGSGKSTLLLLLAGLRPASRGRITFRGEPWTRDLTGSAARRRSQVGFIFQEPFLVAHLTVRENALIQANDAAARASLDPLAARLGMSERLESFPHELSGGQRQRAGVLRALVNRPALVVADEPTAWLDREAGREVMDLIAQESRGAALVVCTHDREILRGAARVLEIRDGRLQEGARAGG